MRELTSHKCSDLNESIAVCVMDKPGPGGANHEYHIVVVKRLSNFNKRICINFQEGAVKDVGVNGISDEALLAIVRDRLESFQDGPFSCKENEQAMHYVREAMRKLQERTKDRVERGVEGHSKK
jgi:hypothetical protein